MVVSSGGGHVMVLIIDGGVAFLICNDSEVNGG